MSPFQQRQAHAVRLNNFWAVPNLCDFSRTEMAGPPRSWLLVALKLLVSTSLPNLRLRKWCTAVRCSLTPSGPKGRELPVVRVLPHRDLAALTPGDGHQGGEVVADRPVDQHPLVLTPETACLGSPEKTPQTAAALTGSPEKTPQVAALMGSPEKTPQAAALMGSPEKTPQAAPLMGSPEKTPQAAALMGSPEKTPQAAPLMGSPEKTPQAAPLMGSPEKTPQAAPLMGSPEKTPEAAPLTGSPEKTPQSAAALTGYGGTDVLKDVEHEYRGEWPTPLDTANGTGLPFLYAIQEDRT
ncbi:hypothetical protein CRUP_006532 [Coryphaenoides rupestris]|nr:hypothetical protein CRUP_006532 [Coryphaenoides rupestris]